MSRVGPVGSREPLEARVQAVETPLPTRPTGSGLAARIKLFLASDIGAVLKWGLMASVLVWLLIYRLSEGAEKLPDFVYVNF